MPIDWIDRSRADFDQGLIVAGRRLLDVLVSATIG
jgi:hypothetical protein